MALVFACEGGLDDGVGQPGCACGSCRHPIKSAGGSGIGVIENIRKHYDLFNHIAWILRNPRHRTPAAIRERLAVGVPPARILVRDITEIRASERARSVDAGIRS